MTERLQAPRGTFDILPDQAEARAAVEAKAKDLLESAGYRRIETPAFEATELFARGVGRSTDIVQKEMYTFDDGGGRSITLRPEGTAPVARTYIEHGMHKLPAPVKLWYLGAFFRRERAQAGRYRQFWQVGAEALGSPDPAVDAEVIVLLHTLLEELSVKDVRLRVSSLGQPDTRAEYLEELKEYLRAHADQVSKEVRDRIDLNPLRAFDADDPATRATMQDAPKLIERLPPQDAGHFAEVRRLLDTAGVAYEIDPTLVRGIDYYTRTVFEFTSDALGAQSGVGAGGRYDALVQELGGPPTPAVGWATGIERVLLAGGEAPTAALPVELFVALDDGARPEDAFATVVAARRAGIRADMELAGRSLKGQLKQADRLGARYVAILTATGAELRDMASSEQEAIASDPERPTVSANSIVTAALRALRGGDR